MAEQIPLGGVLGAPPRSSSEEDMDDFSWLDGIDEDNCYMPIDCQRPSKSYDFGQGGYTGSITSWHELLQLTGADNKHGVVFVRGDFPDNTNFILARAQRRNLRGTFGLGVDINRAAGSDPRQLQTVLEQTPAHGMVNMRWPCTRFHYVQNDELGYPIQVASFTGCSFIKDGTLHQIIHICPQDSGSPGGTSSPLGASSDGPRAKPLPLVRLKIHVGGLFRFGAARSLLADDGSHWPLRDTYVQEGVCGTGPCYALGCRSLRLEKRLEMRLWINGSAVDMSKTDRSCDQGNRLARPPDVMFGHEDEIAALRAEVLWDLFASHPVNIVASFRLASADEALRLDMTPPITSRVAQKYVGHASDSLSAPYRLWSYVMHEPPGTEALELNAIGRCAEAILGLSTVPVLRPGLPPAIALIKNIMSGQVVDFQNAFWQIRFLHTQGKGSSDSSISDEVHTRNVRMLAEYRNTVSTTLEGVYSWVIGAVPLLSRSTSADLSAGMLPSDILRTNLQRDVSSIARQPSRQRSSSHQRRISLEPGSGNFESNYSSRGQELPTEKFKQKIRMQSQKWYCAMILWYTLEQLPRQYVKTDMIEQLWTVVEDLASFRYENKDNLTDTAILDDAYGCVLRWYHSYAVWKICKKLQGDDAERFGKLHIDVKEAKHKELSDHWQSKAEKAFRLFGQGRLLNQTLGYQVAYLTMVGTELGVDQGPRIPFGVGLSCLEHVTKLIAKRPGTATLYPGASRISRWDSQKLRPSAQQSAPWELSCFGHHVPLCFDVPESQEEITQNCWQFLLSDGLFLGSIDACKIDLVCQWWDLTASSVICAKLLEEIEFSVRRRASWMAPDDASPAEPRGSKALSMGSVAEAAEVTASPTQKTIHVGLVSQPKATKRPRPKIVRFESVNEAGDSRDGDMGATALPRSLRKSPLFSEAIQGRELREYTEPFTWEWRLPAFPFHPDSALFSLANTPDIFDLKRTRDIFVRPQIAKNYRDSWNSAAGKKHWTLRSVYNILRPVVLKNLSCVDLSISIDSSGGPEVVITQRKGRLECADVAFWSRLLPAAAEVVDGAHGVAAEESIERTLVNTLVSNPGLLDLYFIGKPAKHPSYDSIDNNIKALLGQESTRQRFLEAYQSSLLNTLNDSLVDMGTRYRIMFVKELTPELARSLIYMWHPDALDTIDNHLGSLSQFFDLPGQQAPSGGDGLWKHVSNIRELPVSLVMTGDWGRYWTCTVISELVDGSLAQKYAAEARDILQMFVNQQYTGRVLVFLVLLGYLCESLAAECEKFLDELERIMEMDAMVLLEGMAWSKSDVALKKLKRMLWGLEALRIFSDKLGRAIGEVKRARAKLATWLMVGYNLRHPDMEREKQHLVEDFDKREDRLRNAHASIQQRIEQGNRLREGISSVISVEQNENISMLTWVTIAYLPLAFVAGLFSMDHLILPLNAGWAVYGWLNVVFLVSTVVFALTLQYWITTFRHVGAAVQGVSAKTSRPVKSKKSHADKSGLFGVACRFNPFGVRRRRVGTTKNDEEAVTEQEDQV
ncbi:hypothetical protein QBC34DRAFT_472436 [Podospora aff. communis PSN243]|uniref:Uncharacterized protein n=1 Tax=Podospora aff. communis PSN243 TaxID=3040156 RepID=A0AAV9GCV8_9PEZI|nr:hypothetical protein QBC34DRAFT_472436 [Podospora aff. communis PSN243]